MAAVAMIGVGIGIAGPATADELYELGEYLSGECRTCHRSAGGETIPAINGWAVDMFVQRLKAYRDGTRDNPAMRRVARSLSDEDMRALAVFFEKLGQ